MGEKLRKGSYITSCNSEDEFNKVVAAFRAAGAHIPNQVTYEKFKKWENLVWDTDGLLWIIPDGKDFPYRAKYKTTFNEIFGLGFKEGDELEVVNIDHEFLNDSMRKGLPKNLIVKNLEGERVFKGEAIPVLGFEDSVYVYPAEMFKLKEKSSLPDLEDWAELFSANSLLVAAFFELWEGRSSILASKIYEVVKKSEYTPCGKLFRKIKRECNTPLASMNAQLIIHFEEKLLAKNLGVEIGSGKTEPLVSVVKNYMKKLNNKSNDLLLSDKGKPLVREGLLFKTSVRPANTHVISSVDGDYCTIGLVDGSNTDGPGKWAICQVQKHIDSGEWEVVGSLATSQIVEYKTFKDPYTLLTKTQPKEENTMKNNFTFTTTVKAKPYQVLPATAVFYDQKVEDMDEADLCLALKKIDSEQQVLKELETGDACKRVNKQIKTLEEARKHVITALDNLPDEDDE